jgi:sugar-specific transcriptional regulator TrmB
MLVVNKETLALLRRLGLNQYESKTYLALVSSNALTATELSEIAQIPRPRVYDVLAKLEKKGFIITKPGRPSKYVGVPPAAALESLKQEKSDSHAKEIEELDKLQQKLVSVINSDELEIGGGEDVLVISDRKNIYSTLATLIESAKKHVVLASHPDGLARKREQYGSLLHKAKKRGVDVVIREAPRRVAIIDDNVFLFLSDPKDGRNDKVAWLKSDYVAGHLKGSL